MPCTSRPPCADRPYSQKQRGSRRLIHPPRTHKAIAKNICLLASQRCVSGFTQSSVRRGTKPSLWLVGICSEPERERMLLTYRPFQEPNLGDTRVLGVTGRQKRSLIFSLSMASRQKLQGRTGTRDREMQILSRYGATPGSPREAKGPAIHIWYSQQLGPQCAYGRWRELAPQNFGDSQLLCPQAGYCCFFFTFPQLTLTYSLSRDPKRLSISLRAGGRRARRLFVILLLGEGSSL